MICTICMICSHHSSVHDLDLPGSAALIPILYDLYHLYDLYDLAHVAGLDSNDLHDLGHVVLRMICTVQIMHNLSQRQVRS